MKCHFCKEEMVEYKEDCIFCENKGCSFCNGSGKMTIVQCTNLDCEPPDHNLEPWDDDEY